MVKTKKRNRVATSCRMIDARPALFTITWRHRPRRLWWRVGLHRPSSTTTTISSTVNLVQNLLSGSHASALRFSMNTADQFDGKIAEYIEKARSLREQRNSQIPLISRIPSELLAGVFEFLAQVDPDEPSPSPYHQPERSSGDYHPCENVTRVCRKWRILALSMSSIWGVFYANCSQQWMDYIIAERLKSMSPISIRSPHKRRFQQRDVLALRLDSERFSHLDLVLDSDRTMNLMHKVLRSKNLPELNTLCMTLDSTKCHSLDPNGFVWRAEAPRLHSLRLEHVLLKVQIASFPSLQEFKLDLSSFHGRLHPVQLLNALHAMPQLRTFECLGLLEYRDRKPIPADLQVELPHLEHLAISKFRWEDLVIFEHITTKPLISFRIDLLAQTETALPDLQSIWKLLPPPSASIDSWHTILHKRLYGADDKFGLVMQISSPSPEFRFELATEFKLVGATRHVESDIYSSLPSASTPDVVALTSQWQHRPCPSLKRFALDMAGVAEFHFIDLTQLLEALLPNQHLEGVHPPLQNAATRATKSKSKLVKPASQNGFTLSSFPIYLPGLRRIVVVQQADLGGSLNIILSYLGQIFLKRKKRGLPIMVVKLGQLSLDAEQRMLVGDGISTELTFIDQGERTGCIYTPITCD
ncbi:hypothetical protein CCMSSC00406_0002272 [Pleurotus cornucopiae]|uniref:Uncharacterized protein n=1 Tax=Pleurotus cornucopiae TaxID=5321 RepID=A0ACB7J1Y2_PLECO|nr:hypothetical protein CCMSSC00406_0002272 [Pleurotus cornucopiae]